MIFINLIFNILIITLFVFLTLPVHAVLDGQNDWQFWTVEAISVPLNDSIRNNLQVELRWGNGCSYFYHWNVQYEFEKKVTDWLRIVPGFREITSRNNSEREWRKTHEPIITFNAEKNWKCLELINRFRIQYSFEEKSPNSGAGCRERIQVKVSTRWGLTPLISDEIFFRRHEGFHRNRFIAGFEGEALKKVVYQMYYQRETRKASGGEWIGFNVIAFRSTCSF